MDALRPLSPGDDAELRSFLAKPPGLHVYLESRLDVPEEGKGFVYREREKVAGFAWFGTGRNFLLAGEEPGFIRTLAALARKREPQWLMLVGQQGPASDLLGIYLPRTDRRPRLDRSQTFYWQDAGTLSHLEEPSLAPATLGDLDELVPISARMSAEDFEIDYWRIDKSEVRRGMERKVREGRTFVYRENGRIVFKADVAVTCPTGAQVEGVYTSEDRRGRGIASRCMAELGRRLIGNHPLLTLHVASENAAARKAYERAGYRRGEELRLTIFPPRW